MRTISLAFRRHLSFPVTVIASSNIPPHFQPTPTDQLDKQSTMDSSMSNSIPVMRKPTDAMSTGLNSSNLAASAMQRHPIDRMQRGEEFLVLVLMLVKKM